MNPVINGVEFKATKHKNYYVTKDGVVAKIKIDKEGNLKLYQEMATFVTNGYLRVTLFHNQKYFVHRLVFETWKEPLEDGKVIDHIDGDTMNNNVSNLRQVSQKENVHNAIHHGNFGHNHNTRILVTDNETNISKVYNSVKEFYLDIGAPEYMIKNGGLGCISKRKDYLKKYTVVKIDKG